jgi:para-nitrobenzyl esterase
MDQWAHRWGRPVHRSILFSPVVEGEVLAVTPWQALTDGTGRDIELLVGHTRDEQRLFSAINGCSVR